MVMVNAMILPVAVSLVTVDQKDQDFFLVVLASYSGNLITGKSTTLLKEPERSVFLSIPELQ